MTREWGRTVSPADIPDLIQATEEFGKLWGSMKFPWHPSMDGTANDIQAIDYLHYEGIGFPPCGIGGATLVAAEVIRRAARIEWVRAHDGELYRADADPSYVVICPRSRVEEIQLAGIPQFGRFAHFAVRAEIDCYGWLADADGALRRF